jgi:Uma2 family endonuclease
MAGLKTPTCAREAEPTWEIAELFPTQGNWSEEEYLALPDNRLLEFAHGFLEVLPVPTTSHQALVAYFYGLLLAFVSQHDLGELLFAPIRVRLWRGKFREPDLVFMLKSHARRIGEEFWDGADLALEVLSTDAKDRRRDLVTKRGEYARARIPEYWIVDPQERTITVLRLTGKRYVVHGCYRAGSRATSPLLTGFDVDVSATFAQARAALGARPKVARIRR